MDWHSLLQAFVQRGISTGIRIIIALLILFVSFKLINRVTTKLLKRGEKKSTDKTILKTAIYAFKIAAKCLVCIALVGFLGIDTSGVTALIASLGVGIGLAVNGALSNLAGGLLLLVTRPFKVDDFIEAQGFLGTVEDIRIIHTQLLTTDNKVVHIPNGSLANESIINYSEKDLRRVDFEFDISYSSDFKKAQSLIFEYLSSHKQVLSSPAVPTVRMSAHAPSGIKIKARAWTKTADYWTVYYDTLESVKSIFEKNGIEIPFQQLDIHIKKEDG